MLFPDKTVLPRHALILAAGLGSRLRPLTSRTPKPLIPVWGTPLLDLAISLLQEWGVEHFAVNTHWQSDAIADHLEQRWPDLDVRISREEQILGTGGALLPLREMLEPLEAFWIFNADVIASLNPEPLLKHYRKTDAMATLWMTAAGGPRTVEVEPDGTITAFHSQHPGSPGTFTFTGLHLLSGKIFRHLEGLEPPFSIVTAYRRAQAAGDKVTGVEVSPSWWADSGTPESLLSLHREIRERAVEGSPGGQYYRKDLDREDSACIIPGARVPPSVRATNCLIGRDAEIAPGVRLENCLVAAGTVVYIDARDSVLASPADFDDARIESAVAALGWLPEKTGVAALDARGSDRVFYRAACGTSRAMLCLYGEQRSENRSYAPLATALWKADIPVPELLAESSEQRWLVLEDLGGDDLLSRASNCSPEKLRQLYAPVLETVVKLHRDAGAVVGGIELQPAFGGTVYRWEHNLFEKYLLEKRMGYTQQETAPVMMELATLSAGLHVNLPVTLHRDLQSTNILFHRGRACLIDFQGLRFGPAAYDLASLLCDPYVCLPRQVRQELLEDYAGSVLWGAETVRMFSRAAVQRLIQALGAYARLAALPGTERFAASIVPAATILLEESAGLPHLARLRETMQEVLRRELSDSAD